MEEEKTYFTEITEYEKAMINLMRGFVQPYCSIPSFLDHCMNEVVNKFTEKQLRFKAFNDVLTHERDNEELSNLELMARVNLVEAFVNNEEEIVNKAIAKTLSQVVEVMEGDILPLGEDESDSLKAEESLLDKLED